MTPTMAPDTPRTLSTRACTGLSDALPSPGSVPGPAPTSEASPDAHEPSYGPPVRRAADLLAGVVAQLDPSRLTGAGATQLYELLAGIERLSTAGRMLLAPRIEESGIWRDNGHRTPAVMLAELEGVPTGQARRTLEVGQRLTQLPGTEEALRTGVLSGAKVSELSGAAVLDPANEQELLRGAGEQPLHQVRERCQRSRATSVRNDPLAAVRRIHADRHFTSWTDPEGAFCFQGRDTADRGAQILQQMEFTTSHIERDHDRAAADCEKARTTERIRRADAFFLLMTGRVSVGDDVGGTLVPEGDDGDPGPPPEQIAGQLVLGRTGVDGAPSPAPRPSRSIPSTAGPDSREHHRPPSHLLGDRADRPRCATAGSHAAG